jgi:hypothetical protein
MVYSPGIVLMRDDYGEWRSPVEVDVLTSAAVNAGEIRRELEREERLTRRRERVAREERLRRERAEYWKRRGEERRKEMEKATAKRQRLREEAALNRKKKEEGAKLDVLTSAAVNAGEIRHELDSLSPLTPPSQAPDPDPNLTYALTLESTEIQINHTMYYRISRILHLFQLQKTPHLILGSFGTGVFKNHIEVIATIFAELLIKSDGRFKDVFQTVVFAILGKETVRVFTRIFRKFDKRAQKEKSRKTCVFKDSFESEDEGDVKEGDDEKMMRMMRWEARKRRYYSSNDEAAYDDPAQIDATSHSFSLDAQASADSFPTSSTAAGAASYTPSLDAAQAYSASPKVAEAIVASCPPSSDATRASAILHFTSSADAAIPANPTYDGIPEDAKMNLTRGDEQVDHVAEATVNAPVVPNAMVEDDMDVDSRSNKNDDDDIEMEYVSDSDGSALR